jgi:hypothetical protein
MIKNILARVGISFLLTACGAHDANIGQEAQNAGESPVVMVPSDPGLPNGNIQMSSPTAESRISVSGKIPLIISMKEDAGINDVEFHLGQDRVYLQLGLKGVPMLEINQTIDLLKCGAINITPGRKELKVILYLKNGSKKEISLGMLTLY